MKKKKKSKDIFDTENCFYKIVDDPYQVIAGVFSGTALSNLRKQILKLFHYSESDKVYKAKAPMDILWYIRLVNSMIKAAHALKEKKKGPLLVSETDLFNKKYYCRNFQQSNEWTDFPRSLSKGEFCNPYIVFKRFFKYQNLKKWLDVWREIGDNALSKFAGQLELDQLKLCTYMLKLIEAAHLIDVREVTHIDGRLKNR